MIGFLAASSAYLGLSFIQKGDEMLKALNWELITAALCGLMWLPIIMGLCIWGVFSAFAHIWEAA